MSDAISDTPVSIRFSINVCAAEFSVKGILATALPASRAAYTKDIDLTKTDRIPINTTTQAHILLPESLSIYCCDWVSGVGWKVPLSAVGQTRSAQFVDPLLRWMQQIRVLNS